MNSLRFRLVLGFSLVAIVPLAVAMTLLSRQIRNTVRAEAAERLNAALGLLQSQLHADGQRTLQKLALLAQDPELKRLYLVQSAGGRDLDEYLAEKRFLLGLDFLLLGDSSGGTIADAATAPSVLAAGGERVALRAEGGPAPAGLELLGVEARPALAVAASAPILYRNERAGMLRGGVVLDSLFLGRLKQTSDLDLVLRDADGGVVASTLVRDARSALPSRADAPREVLGGRSYLTRSFALEPSPPSRAGITGLISTAAADRTIAALQVTSLSLGLLGVAIAVALGMLWSHQISRPVERLATFAQRIAHGEWDEPLALRSVRELDALVSSMERMRRDLRSYRERLVASERHAAWSLMARKVAHEVRNPLTPIAVSIADLKRSYELKRSDFPEILDQAARTIGEEVQALKRMLQEFSEFGRFPEPRFGTCRLAELLADVGALYGRDIAEGRLSVAGPEQDVAFRADRAQLMQALVNLIKNGLEAVDGGGRVQVTAQVQDAAVELVVSDTGPGLDAEQRARLFVPDFTTKRHGSGLGLTIVERIVNDHRGSIRVDTAPGRGTAFHIRIPTG